MIHGLRGRQGGGAGTHPGETGRWEELRPGMNRSSKSLEHVPRSHQTSLTKYQFCDRLIKNVSMTTAELEMAGEPF